MDRGAVVTGIKWVTNTSGKLRREKKGFGQR